MTTITEPADLLFEKLVLATSIAHDELTSQSRTVLRMMEGITEFIIIISRFQINEFGKRIFLMKILFVEIEIMTDGHLFRLVELH